MKKCINPIVFLLLAIFCQSAAAKTFELVTSVDELNESDTYIMLADVPYANNANRNCVSGYNDKYSHFDALTKIPMSIAGESSFNCDDALKTVHFKFKKSEADGIFYISTDKGFIYVSGNNLLFDNSVGEVSKWNVSFDNNGVAKLLSVGKPNFGLYFYYNQNFCFGIKEIDSDVNADVSAMSTYVSAVRI